MGFAIIAGAMFTSVIAVGVVTDEGWGEGWSCVAFAAFMWLFGLPALDEWFARPNARTSAQPTVVPVRREPTGDAAAALARLTAMLTADPWVAMTADPVELIQRLGPNGIGRLAWVDGVDSIDDLLISLALTDGFPPGVSDQRLRASLRVLDWIDPETGEVEEIPDEAYLDEVALQQLLSEVGACCLEFGTAAVLLGEVGERGLVFLSYELTDQFEKLSATAGLAVQPIGVELWRQRGCPTQLAGETADLIDELVDLSLSGGESAPTRREDEWCPHPWCFAPWHGLPATWVIPAKEGHEVILCPGSTFVGVFTPPTEHELWQWSAASEYRGRGRTAVRIGVRLLVVAVVLGSFGLLNWVATARAAAVTERRRDYAAFLVVIAANGFFWISVAIAPETDALTEFWNIPTVVLVATTVIGTLHYLVADLCHAYRIKRTLRTQPLPEPMLEPRSLSASSTTVAPGSTDGRRSAVIDIA
ncbi:hypothetical protein [Nocardia sp. NPDC058705]|uniref:hypothetical protein n=1 Tax=Nocardia sp. NPDC058705 TaxID=3346609 RepID=UPI0036845775